MPIAGRKWAFLVPLRRPLPLRTPDMSTSGVAASIPALQGALGLGVGMQCIGAGQAPARDRGRAGQARDPTEPALPQIPIPVVQR